MLLILSIIAWSFTARLGRKSCVFSGTVIKGGTVCHDHLTGTFDTHLKTARQEINKLLAIEPHP
jgi:hypothetical protein